MKLFRRTRGIYAIQPRRGFGKVMAAASLEAGPAGIDSLDLLVSALRARKVARLVVKLGVDPVALSGAARSAGSARHPSPGLTDDAKAVVEACSHRALETRKPPDVEDLLIGLSIADCAAGVVLREHGISEDRLIGLIGRG
jgi:hypothetical protein